jgi:hypothetical protein
MQILPRSYKLKEIPGLPDAEEMAKLIVRAKLVGRQVGEKKLTPENKRIRRSDVKRIEHTARSILAITGEGACAKLAKDMLMLATSIDNIAAEIYPVFEMVDKKVVDQGCSVKHTREGWAMCSPSGHVLSSGATFRDWLIDHVQRYGDQETAPYDPTSE